MFVIESDDADLLANLAGFLAHTLPGEVVVSEGRLCVELAGTLRPEAERRLLDRLVWAWQTERQVPPTASLAFTYVEQALDASCAGTASEPATEPTA